MDTVQLKNLLAASELFSLFGCGSFERASVLIGHDAAFAMLVHELSKRMGSASLSSTIDELSIYVEPQKLVLHVREHLYFYILEEMALDTFSAHSIEWNGVLWQTCEHAYQAAKFDYKDGPSDIVNQIRLARSPFEAKRIAHLNKSNANKNWANVKIAVMRHIIRLKITQHADVRAFLVATGNKILVENSRTDSFWGSGEDFRGLNNTGILWMETRAEINLRKI
jgi:ribA/ribD-fused uncharacterized protein